MSAYQQHQQHLDAMAAAVGSGGNGSQNQYVTELRPADVLFGRGSGPNDHIGNIRFRQYVAERKAQYNSTNHRLTKTKIARDIVTLVLQEHGRFVKKVEAQELQTLGLPENSDYYELVDDETVMEKAKQALRQNQVTSAASAVVGAANNTGGTAVLVAANSNAVPAVGSIRDGSSHSMTPTFATSGRNSSAGDNDNSNNASGITAITASSGTSQSENTDDLFYSDTSVPPELLRGTRQSANRSSTVTVRANNLTNSYLLNDPINSSSNSNAANQLPYATTTGAIGANNMQHLFSSAATMNSTDDVTASFTSYDLEPLPLLSTSSSSQIPIGGNNNNPTTVSTTTAPDWSRAAAGSVGVGGGGGGGGYTTTTNTIDLRRLQQQQRQHQYQQLQEQQILLQEQQRRLQIQMAAVYSGSNLDADIDKNNNNNIAMSMSQVHQQQQQQQQAQLLLRQQQLADSTGARTQNLPVGLYPIGLPNTTAGSTSDSSNYNSSMGQLPHEEVRSFAPRHSITVKDLEQVRAEVTDNRDTNKDHLLNASSIQGGNYATTTDNHNNQYGRSMNNSIGNMSMSMQQLLPRSSGGRADSPLDDVMGSFSQMKTPSMETGLDANRNNSNTTGSNNRNDNNDRNNSSMLQQNRSSRMMASTETMGTIEPIGSVADMSFMMGSSTFSLFRHANEGSAVMGESGTTGTTSSTSGATAGSATQRQQQQVPSPPQLQRQNSSGTNNNSQFMNSVLTQPSIASNKTSSSKTSSSIDSESSLHLSGMFSKSATNIFNNSMSYAASDIQQRRQFDHDTSNYIYDDTTGGVATLPRTIGVMLEQPGDETNSASHQNSSSDLDMMGSSSLAVLQSAFLHSTNTEIQGNDQKEDGDEEDDGRIKHEV